MPYYDRATEKTYYDTLYGPLTNVRVSHNAAPSIVNATATRMPFATETTDTLGEWNTTTYRFTAASAGWYLFQGNIQITHFTATAGDLYSALYLNGAQVFQHSFPVAVNSTFKLPIHWIMYMAATDYAEIYGYVTNGTSNTMGSATEAAHNLQITRLR